MAEKGWIKLHRQLQDCPLWYCERFSKGQAWVDLLLMTNHADKKIIFNGQTMVVKRGQYLTSMLKLAEKWQWDRKTVKNFLSLLVKDNMIRVETDNHRTIITIENYSVFQMSDNEELDNTLDNNTDTEITNGTDNTLDTRTDTNKNIKNDKNEKKVSKDTSCAEPKPLATAPVFIEIPLNDGTLYSVLGSDVEEWKRCYPAVDVEQQLRSMKSWCNCNPAKRKTRKGVMRFIDNWLSKEQNKYHGNISARQNVNNSTFDEEKFKDMNDSKWQ